MDALSGCPSRTLTVPANVVKVQARFFTQSATANQVIVRRLKLEKSSYETPFEGDHGRIDAIQIDNGPIDAGATQNTIFRQDATPTGSKGDLWYHITDKIFEP